MQNNKRHIIEWMIVVRKFGKILSLIILVCLVFCGFYFISNKFLDIRNIEVIGDNVLIEIDRSTFPTQLLFFPTEKYRRLLLTENPVLQDIIITKKFPHTLLLEIRRGRSLARLTTLSGEVLIDDSQLVTGYSTPDYKSLPLLDFNYSQIAVGDKINNEEIKYATQIIRNSNAIYPISLIKRTDTFDYKFFIDDTIVVFPKSGDVAALMDTLQTLLARFRMKGIDINEIDLRFDKPIIKS